MFKETEAAMNSPLRRSAAPSTLPADPGASPLASVRRGVPRALWIVLGTLAIVLLVVIILGILSRAAAERSLRTKTDAAAILDVAVVHPTVTST